MEVMNHNDLIGKKIKVGEYSGIIKYSGPLRHEVKSKRIKKDAHWLGIEWDQSTRGTEYARI
jgi:hypothetical protein